MFVDFSFLTCVASLYQLKICLKFNRDSDLSKFVLADFLKKMDPLIFLKSGPADLAQGL
jgi:hypothetical protein